MWKRRYPDLEADLWMFSSSDKHSDSKKLVAVNCSQLTKVHQVQLPAKLADYELFQVVASVKEQGLVCLLAQNPKSSNKTIFLGNPFTKTWEDVPWEDVPCPPHEGTLVAVGATATSVYHANSVKLCCLFQKESGCTACIYDTQSKTWTEGATCSQVEGKDWQCTPECGSTKVYIWRRPWKQILVFAYDMASDEWEWVTKCNELDVDIDSWCNQDENYPTLLVCRGVPYWIGRGRVHKFVKIYRFDKAAERFGLVADFPWCCKNSTIKYGSDGNDGIYVVQRRSLLKYHVSLGNWQVYDIHDHDWLRLGLGSLEQALYPHPQGLVFTKAMAWELLVPCKIPRLGMGQSVWLLMSKNLQYEWGTDTKGIIAVNIRDNNIVVTSKTQPSNVLPRLEWFGASLPELNLVCMLQTSKYDKHNCTRNSFPEKIYIGNPLGDGPWEEIVLFDMSGIDRLAVTVEDGWELADRLKHEFIGVAMQTGSSSGSYMLYYFHKVETSILVKVYDSVTKSWRKGLPFIFENWGQNVPDVQDGRNDWRKRILPSDWQVACMKDKVYVYSSVYCRMEQSNMLRVLSYNVHADAWEVVRWMRFPQDMQEYGQAEGPGKVLVDMQGELFVVGRPEFGGANEDEEHGSLVDIRHVRSESLELVAQLNVTGNFRVAGDSDSNRIFVAVWEDKRNHPLRKTRLMVYDLEAGEWSEYPVELPDFKCHNMILH